jgi:hypothetical protein
MIGGRSAKVIGPLKAFLIHLFEIIEITLNTLIIVRGKSRCSLLQSSGSHTRDNRTFDKRKTKEMDTATHRVPRSPNAKGTKLILQAPYLLRP